MHGENAIDFTLGGMSAHRSCKGVRVLWRVVSSSARRYGARQHLQRPWRVRHYRPFSAGRNRASPISSFAACPAKWRHSRRLGSRSHRHCPMDGSCRGQRSLGTVASVTSAQAPTHYVVSRQTQSSLGNCLCRPHRSRLRASFCRLLHLAQCVGRMVRRARFVMGRCGVRTLLSLRGSLGFMRCPIASSLQQPSSLAQPMSAALPPNNPVHRTVGQLRWPPSGDLQR